jgi:hypothetical protein
VNTVFEHPSDGMVARYLDQELDQVQTRMFEMHVERCSECADRLQAEARLEAALYQAAECSTARPAPRAHPIIPAMMAAMAAAAVFLLGSMSPGQWLDAAALRPTVASLQGERGAAEPESAFACLPSDTNDDASSCEVVLAMATFPPDEFERGYGVEPDGGVCVADDGGGDDLVCASPV